MEKYRHGEKGYEVRVAAMKHMENEIMALSAQDVLRTVKQATSKEDMLFLTAVAMEWVLTKMIEKGY